MASKAETYYPPYEGSEPYIHLCFSHRDERKVRPLLRRLLLRGCRVWYSAEQTRDRSAQLSQNERMLGAGLTVFEPQGSFIVDIGAGKTEIALASMGGIVLSHSIPVAGAQIDREIVEYIRREYEMSIVGRTAEQIKFDLTDISREDTSGRYIVVRGRDIATGMPTTAEIRIEGIRSAVCTVLDQILEAIKWVLSRVPPEMCVDVLKNGIIVCGGSSQFPKLDEMISAAFGVPAVIAREAGECAVLGAGYMADHFEVYNNPAENKKL